MKASKPLAAAAALTGLKSEGSWLYGRFRGFPTAVKELGPMQNYNIVYQLVVALEAAPSVQSLIADKERVKGLGLKPSGLSFDAGASEIVYAHQPTIRTKPEDVQRTLDSLVSLAAAGGPAPPQVCDTCKANPATGVVVANNIPLQLCEADLKNLLSTAQVGTRVASTRRNYRCGISYGLVGMLAGAGIWAAIGIATGYIFSLAAFGIAALIAFLLIKGTGTVTVPLVLLMSILTVFAIFLGDMLWIAVLITRLGGPFDLGLALQAWLAILSEDRSLLMSYFFGILGVVGASIYMMRLRTEAKARFEVYT